MKKTLTLSLALLLVISTIAACDGTQYEDKGVEGSPSRVIDKFFDSSLEHAVKLCSSNLDPLHIEDILEKSATETYNHILYHMVLTQKDGYDSYENIHGKRPELGKNETIYGIVVTREMGGAGYVIIVKNPKTEKYYIKEIELE